MKKLFLTLIFCIFAICTYAQEPLTFKGIPIEGNITDFCKKLEAKGFTEMDDISNGLVFKGIFTGQQVTTVVGADEENSVIVVAVFFDSKEEWEHLVNQYNYYKSIYTKKYGEPTSIQESSSTLGDTNLANMLELHNGTLKYESTWMVPGGNINLEIQKSVFDSDLKGAVVISYINLQNTEYRLQRYLEEI